MEETKNNNSDNSQIKKPIRRIIRRKKIEPKVEPKVEHVEQPTPLCYEVFRVEYTPYICYRNNGHNELRNMNSKEFGMFFRQILRKAFPNKSSKDYNTVIEKLKDEAMSCEKSTVLYNRVAKHDNAIWYNLTNDEWKAVRIDKEGWNIEQSPILFNRWGHEIPQCNPIKSSSENINLLFTSISKYPNDIKELIENKYMNIKLNIFGEKKLIRLQNKDDEFLYTVDLITKFIPSEICQHPIDNFYGASGGGKSYTQKLTKKLVDPDILEISTMPRKIDDLFLIVKEHWYVAFENLSKIKDDFSDAMCSIVTGTGYMTRSLYTTGDSTTYKYKSCVGFNGIDNLPGKADLINRVVNFKVKNIEKDERIGEKDLTSIFNETKPYILGAIFDIISKAISLKTQDEKSGFRLPEINRLADYETWGYYIGNAIEKDGGQRFRNLYNLNILSKDTEIIYTDSVFESLYILMNYTINIEKGFWEGTPTNLFTELSNIKSLGLESDIDNFPKSPNGLGMRLGNLETNLSNIGLLIKRANGAKRLITIKWKPEKRFEMLKEIIERILNEFNKTHDPKDWHKIIKLVSERKINNYKKPSSNVKESIPIEDLISMEEQSNINYDEIDKKWEVE